MVLDPRRAKRWPLLALSLLCIVPAGGAYIWQFAQGLRGSDLLGFAAAWVAVPLGAGLLFLFAYLKPAKGTGNTPL
jgi:hypothetical protein